MGFWERLASCSKVVFGAIRRDPACELPCIRSVPVTGGVRERSLVRPDRMVPKQELASSVPLKNSSSQPRHDSTSAKLAGRSLAAPTDADLLAAIARKDQAAFAELYDRFADRMFGLILKLLRQRTEAEDVLQDVFMHIWNRADGYNPCLGSPLVWMMLVTRARAIDYLRRRGAQATAVASLHARMPVSDQNGHSNHHTDNGTAGHRSPDLSGLPADQFEAIHLAYHGGLTCSQIADLRQLPIGTVKTRIRLGMRKLRELAERTSEVARP